MGDSEKFGSSGQALAVTLRAHGRSLGKVQDFLCSVWGFEVAVAANLSWEQTAANGLDPIYQGLYRELTDAEINPSSEGDETSFPIDGENGGTWVGVGGNAWTVVYSTLPTRGLDGALGMWKGYSGGLTRDAYHSYNVLEEANHQMEPVHVNRWLQKVEVSHHIEPREFLIEKPPKYEQAGRPPAEFLQFATGVSARLQEPVLWHEGHAKLRSRARDQRQVRVVKWMRRFGSRLWKGEGVVRIAKDINGRLPGLYLFLKDPLVSWNSNDAERKVRVFVACRKMAGGRRT